MKLQISISAKSASLTPSILKNSHVTPIDVDLYDVFGDS
jgi:hypothetical protein